MNPLNDQLDLDLMHSRRAFPVAQQLLSGPVVRREAEAASIGWHGSEVNGETGSIALVREDGPYAALRGRVILVEHLVPGSKRGVYAYVYASGPIADDFSLTRRAFFGLGLLAEETLDCAVSVVAT